jgi:diguanylate cyclase (GGDEF)-like protein
MDKNQQDLLELIYAWLFTARPPDIKEEDALPPRMVDIVEYLRELRIILTNFAKGNINEPVNIRGILGGHLKGLQANLRHLAWQAHMVAKGDLRQRVTFMGEFSVAFNEMVEQLERNLQEITTSRDKLAELNNILLRRIKTKELDEDKLRRSEQYFKQLAITDQLTNAMTRRQLITSANMELTKAIENKEPLCLLMLDADHFKLVNDTYGHLAGDQVLRSLADRFRNVLRDNDILARYGGEEFVILLPRATKETGYKVAERIRHGVGETPIETTSGIIPVTISIGQTYFNGAMDNYPPDNTEEILRSMINQADIALYIAKQRGRNQVIFGGPDNGDYSDMILQKEPEDQTEPK